jgi:hypothetical protein
MTVKIQAELTAKDNLSPTLSEVQKTFEKFKISVEENNRGVRKLENSFQNFGTAATGLEGNIGKVADALIEFAPGGIAGVAAIAGIAAIILYFQNLGKATDEAKKKTGELYAEYLRLSGKIVEAENKVAEAANKKYSDAVDAAAKLRKEVVDLQTAIDTKHVNPDLALTAAQAIALLTKTAQLAKADAEAETAKQEAQNKGVVLQKAATTEYYKRITALLALQAANKLTAAQAQELAVDEKQLRTNVNIGTLDIYTRVEALSTLTAIETQRAGKITKAAADEKKRQDDIKAALKAVEDGYYAQIKALEDLADAGKLTLDEFITLIQRETELQQKVGDTNLSLEERARALNALAPLFARTKKALDDQTKAEKDPADAAKKAEEDKKKALEETFKYYDKLASVISGPVPELITAAMVQQAIDRIALLQSTIADTRLGNGMMDETVQENIAKSIGQIGKLKTALEDLPLTNFGNEFVKRIPEMSAAFTELFSIIGQGGDVFFALGEAIRSSIAKAAQTEAASEFAQGLKSIAQGIFGVTGPNPLAFAAGAKHFAAAAAFAAIGGSIGRSGGSAGGGGGGVGGSAGVNNSQLGSTQTAQGTVTINLTGGSILDMSNIDTQRSFIKAIETLTNKRAIVIGA